MSLDMLQIKILEANISGIATLRVLRIIVRNFSFGQIALFFSAKQFGELLSSVNSMYLGLIANTDCDSSFFR